MVPMISLYRILQRKGYGKCMLDDSALDCGLTIIFVMLRVGRKDDVIVLSSGEFS
jgi:hypothetical protein